MEKDRSMQKQKHNNVTKLILAEQFIHLPTFSAQSPAQARGGGFGPCRGAMVIHLATSE